MDKTRPVRSVAIPSQETFFFRKDTYSFCHWLNCRLGAFLIRPHYYKNTGSGEYVRSMYLHTAPGQIIRDKVWTVRNAKIFTAFTRARDRYCKDDTISRVGDLRSRSE